jgi:hypothetical protein
MVYFPRFFHGLIEAIEVFLEDLLTKKEFANMSTTIKNIMLSMFLISNLMFASTPLAAMLAWDANTDPVDGYRIHYGTSATAQSQTLDVGNVTSYNLEGLPLSESTQYYISLTAYNDAGESVKAGPLVYTPADTTPPAPPIGLEAVPPN